MISKKKAIKKSLKQNLIQNEGGTPTNMRSMQLSEDTQEKELQILNYAKTAKQLWRLDPITNSELPMFSLFMQLNEGESDLMASFEEIDPIIRYVEPITDQSGKVIQKPEDRALQAFEKYQASNFLSFRQFQNFMQDLDLTKRAEFIDHYMYRYYFRKNCLTLCIGRCFASPCRKVRMGQVANRLKKHVEIENGMTPTKPAGMAELVAAFMSVMGGYAQLFDFYSDIIVIYVVYYASLDPKNQEFVGDYEFTLTILFLAVSATFMAQQSCVIGMKFAQGDFEPQNFKEYGFFQKIINILMLTFIGAFLIIPIELLDNLSKLLKLPAVLLGGAKGVQKTQDCFDYVKSKITGLNVYQLNSLEKQRKVTALLFENLPFTLLVFAIKLDYLRCRELSDGKSSTTVNISLASTLLQVASTMLVTYMESSWLQESTLSYLMTKMTANNNWIPFIHKIAKRDCTININFGDLSIVIPLISHAMGFQMLTQYEFSDNTLTYLLNELKLWSSEVRGQQLDQRYRLIFTKDCLNQVSLNHFIHFVENFPHDVLMLEIQLDWELFYQQKKQYNLIQYQEEDGGLRTYSPTGVPLLHLCIQNENSNPQWPLKKLLRIVLEEGHYSMFDPKFGSPLTVALQENCFESMHIILDGDYNFDVQKQDGNGPSFVGYLIQKIQDNVNQDGEEFEKLADFSESLFDKIEIDLHKDQFLNISATKKIISAYQFMFKSVRHHRKIRFGTQLIINSIQKKDDYQLSDKEKNTLYKNALKAIMAYSKDSTDSLRKIAQFCLKCNVDIFNTKDRLNRGIHHRLVQAWPVKWSSPNLPSSIFNLFRTKEMKTSGENTLGLVFKNLVRDNLVPDILKKSVFTAKAILYVDEKTTMEIKQLFTPELLPLTQNLLAKSFVVNIDAFQGLIQSIQTRMESIPASDLPMRFDDLNQQVKEKAKLQTQASASQNQSDVNQDDLAEFEGSKLTRRKPGNGNLKRNVCDELQQDPISIKLNQTQKQNLEFKDSSASVKRRKRFGNAMRGTLETTLEWIAAADLYTDFFVLMQLLKTPHHAWTTITIFSLLAPFFACQTPFTMFLKEQVYRDKLNKAKLKFMGYVMINPLMLLYLFCLDFIFIVNQAVLFPLIQILKLITFGFVNLSFLNRALDMSYEYLFEMKKLEVAGFRRMRTISQLTFESLIQMALQLRMLKYFNDHKDTQEADQFGVSVTAIAISILIAFIHAILECLFLYMESQASKTSFVNYVIVCFNGRFGWVPYNDFLIITSKKLSENLNNASQSEKKVIPRVKLDFENVQSKVLCFDLQVEFVFSNDTLLSLTKTLAAFPPVENHNDMPLIRFGSTLNSVSLENIESLLRVCHGKVKIDLNGTDLKSIFQRSKHAKLLVESDCKNLSENDHNYLFELQQSKLNDLLYFILSSNNENLKVTQKDKQTREERTFALIALNERDKDLLDLLLSLNSDVFKQQMREVVTRDSLTVRYLNTVDFDLWVTIANNTDTFNPHQESLIFQAFTQCQTSDPVLFRKSMVWWHARFGPCMPQEIINDVMRYSSAHDFMKEYKKMYPEKVYICSGEHYIEVECRTAFCFASIRKLFVRAWNISAQGPTIDKETSQGTFNKPLDISCLGIPLTDFKLLNMILSDAEHASIKNLTNEKVQQLDEWCYKLKMDTYRWLYVGRTRLGDNTGSQIEVIFYGKDKHCHEPGRRESYEINAGFTEKFDEDSDDQHGYYDSLVVEMPKQMTFMTFHKTWHAVPRQNSSMSTFIFNPDTVARGYLFSYSEQRNQAEQSDATIIAQQDEQGRVEAIKSAKPIYQIDTVKPGATVRYCGQSLWAYTTLQNLRVTMTIDFPVGVDISLEQERLEAQAQISRREYEKSVPIFKSEIRQY